MSAASSPGRTWNGRVVECRLPFLAGKVTADFFDAGCWLAPLPDVGSVPASAADADVWNEGYSGSQPVVQRTSLGRVGCVNHPLSIELSAMKLDKHCFLVILIAAMALPARAQVEKVAIRTTGISCGTCAAVSELYLKRLPSVDKVAISMKNEAVMVSYKAGSTFQPKDLRDVLKKTEVGVTQFQVSAKGHVQDQAGKRFFIAGKDKFVLISGSNSTQIPLNTPVSIEAVVNDRADPMELRVMTFKPVEGQNK